MEPILPVLTEFFESTRMPSFSDTLSSYSTLIAGLDNLRIENIKKAYLNLEDLNNPGRYPFKQDYFDSANCYLNRSTVNMKPEFSTNIKCMYLARSPTISFYSLIADTIWIH